MTQLGPQTPITQHTGSVPQPSRAYPVAPVTGLTPGTSTTIPYPTGLPRSTVPVVMTHCVLANSSPFTLLITQGGNLTQIPAFTADDVIVLEGGQGAPITVTPLATGATFTVGVDTSVYATWYDGDPPGVYPAAIGAGSTPIANQTVLLDQGLSATGTANVTVNVPAWVQALMVRFDDGGTSTARGFYMTVQDAADGTTIMTGWVQGLSQPSFFPVGGRNVILNMSTLLGGGGIGGLFTGRMIVSGLAGPITRLTLGATTTTFPFPTGTGFTAVATQVATGQQQLINPPPLGYIIRLRSVWWTYTVAPAAAGQTLSLRGNASGLNYGAWAVPTTAFTVQPTEQWNIYIGANPTLATTEGLNLVNNNAGTVQMRVNYDVVPIPWGAADQ